MSRDQYKMRYFFHASRIIHGIVTMFQSFRGRNTTDQSLETGFEIHTENAAPLTGQSLNTSLFNDGELLNENHVIPDLKTGDSRKAIKILCETLKSHPGMLNHNQFCADVLKRENLKSTGIGYNLAIPHARSEGVNRILMAVGRSIEGIDFTSLDGDPIRFVVLIGTPTDQVKDYLKLLANTVRMDILFLVVKKSYVITVMVLALCHQLFPLNISMRVIMCVTAEAMNI